MTEFILPDGSGPTAAAAAASDKVWVTLEDTSQIIQLDKGGTLAQYKLPHLTSQPGSYTAADRQGGLWFPERGARAISHLDTAGNYRSCVLPFAAEPIAVALAPDGQVWFADFSGATAGRIDSNGKVVYWSLRGHLGQPSGIQLAKDGSAWVTDFASNTLARVNGRGIVTFTHLPAAGGAFQIYLATDGSLWIAQEGADRIARISTDGRLSDIKLTSAGTHQPQAITQAKNGSFWFTESRADRLGHIAAAGMAVTEIGPLGRWPDGIATSGGMIWFTEYYGQSIGFVDTP